MTSSPDAPQAARRRSGLLVAVPEAEPVVSELRLRHDPVADLGIPAHVTVLFPFVPADAVDEQVQATLHELFAGVAPFAYRFAEVGRFNESTIFLVPEPGEAFSALTHAVVARFPDHPPYEGAFEVVIPHLTVGDQLAEGVADGLHAATGAALATHGPVTGRCTEVLLMAEAADGSWSTVGRYPLGSA